MNSITRALAASLVAAFCATAHAQRFYLADTNGNEIGSTIDIGSAHGSQVTLQIWVENGLITNYTGGNIFVGFDRALATKFTRYSSNAATQAAGIAKKIAISDTFTNLATGLSGFVYQTGEPKTVNIETFTYLFSGAAVADNSALHERSIGTNWTWTVGITNRFNFAPQTKLHLSDLTLTNSSLNPGEVFGVGAGENGLTLNNDAIAQVGTNFLGSGSIYYGTTRKYLVHAVPEPASFFAAFLGLAGLCMRRRRK